MVTRGFQRLFDLRDNEDDEDDEDEVVRVHVEHYIHDRTFKERIYLFMIRDPVSSFWLRLLRFTVKLLSCLLYVIMTTTSSEPFCVPSNGTSTQWVEMRNSSESCSRYDNLFWLERPVFFWALQFCVALLFLVESSLLIFINYSGRLWAAFDRYIVLDLLVGIPFLLPIFYWPLWRLWVPTYLNCWSAKFVLQRLFYDTHRWSGSHRHVLKSKVFVLLLTVFCLIFTSASTLHHLQTVEVVDRSEWSYFNTYWFIIVTLSTVGYGDISPSIWISKLFVVIFIFVVLVVVPAQVESYLRIVQSQRQQGEATAFAVPGEHVVVCSTDLRSNDLRDFLNEFFAYKEKVQDFTVVILSPAEISQDLKLLIQVPLWAHRVLYLQGSALNELDLARARVFDAKACFLMVNRRTKDRESADQRTILRAWSMRDYAPHVPLYVHVLNPENKIYVAMAKQVICEDELKYALLANNCHCVGISSVVTILLHTSREKRGSPDVPWHKTYGSCSGNEIYSVTLGESRLFRPFAGKNFLFTTVLVHRKFGVTLIGVRRYGSDDLLLNPGRNFVLRLDDTCFYISIAREENSKFVTTDSVLPMTRPALRRSLATMAAIAFDFADIRMKSGATEEEKKKKNEKHGLESYCHLRREGSLSKPDQDGEKLLRRMRNVAMGRGVARRKTLDTDAEMRHFEGKSSSENAHATTPTESEGQGGIQGLIRSSMAMMGFGENRKAATDGGSDTKFHGMDVMELKQEAQAKKRALLTPDNGSLTSLHSRSHSVGGSAADRRSLAGSRSTVMPPSVVAPVVLADVVEVDELSDEERSELQDLEAGDQSESSIVDEAAKQAMEKEKPWIRDIKYEKGPPPHYPYLGLETTECHLLPKTKPLCCLELNKKCDHEVAHVGFEKSGRLGAIIIVSSQAHLGVYHFIIPLRAHYLPQGALKPIVILVEQRPDDVFLESISCFPMVYYVVGTIKNVDDLFIAGILDADAMIVASPYDGECNEDYMVDAKNIIAVQKLSRLFPDAKVVTELSSRQNMKFATKFRGGGARSAAAPSRNSDDEIDYVSKSSVSKLSRDHMTYMFRPAFASGAVFTASMLDTLLFQSYIKDWIVEFVYQLLGCQQVNGSGFLWQVRVDDELLRVGTYGRAFQRLAKKCGMLVFGVYRKAPLTYEKDDPRTDGLPKRCRKVMEMLRNRMEALGIEKDLPPAFEPVADAFALVNPKADLPLQLGDLLYVLCAGRYDPIDEDSLEHDRDLKTPTPEVVISEDFRERKESWGSKFLSKFRTQQDTSSTGSRTVTAI